jgi:aldehyde dehydrogenase (NAD+)
VSTESSKLAFNDGWQYAPAPESTDHIQIEDQYGLFIGGEFVAPADDRYFETINPASAEPLCSVGLATKTDVDRAVKAARKAFSGPWSKLSAADRGKYIFRIARILQERARQADS